MSLYNASARIYVINNSGGNATISFSHKLGTDQVQTWQGDAVIAPGDCAGPLTAGFNVAPIGTSNDLWYCEANVVDGPAPGTYQSAGSLAKPGTQFDLDTTADNTTLYFSVTAQTFSISLVDGQFQAPMTGPAAIVARETAEVAS